MSSIVLFLLAAMQGADLTAPPAVIEDNPDCTCPAGSAADLVLSGYVIDAIIIPGADLRTYEARMATIFDVSSSSDEGVTGRTEVWHAFGEAACGVSFDYGKKYTVSARWSEDGEIETDACLMGQ